MRLAKVGCGQARFVELRFDEVGNHISVNNIASQLHGGSLFNYTITDGLRCVSCASSRLLFPQECELAE
jgi:hypothetical protein